MQLVPSIKVLEAADSYDLATLEMVKSYLNITADTEDDRIEKLITFASTVIADMCDRVFALEKVEETIYLEGVPGGINLNRWPLVEVESVINGGAATDDFVIQDAAAGILHGALTGESIITYTAGYDLPEDAPGPLALACIDLIRQTYYAGSRDPYTQSITDNATGSIRFFPPPGVSRTGATSGKATPLTPSATALIAPYRRIALA